LLPSVNTAMLSSSFGWFSNNDKVSATGISVSSVSKYDTEESLWMLNKNALVPFDNSLFAGMCPADQRTVFLKVVNKESVKLTLDLLLSAPIKDTTDTGYADENTGNIWYYLGTQMRVVNVQISDSNGTISDTAVNYCALTGSNAFLLTIPDANGTSFYTKDGKQGVGATTAQIESAFAAAAQKKMTQPPTDGEPITIAANKGEVYIAITFEFAENGQVQNPYIDFGTEGDHAGYKLERDILCWYNQATTSAN
jgi:hypothetical protein